MPKLVIGYSIFACTNVGDRPFYPFVYAFNFFDQHTLSFIGRSYEVGPQLLLDIPDNIKDSILYPNFGKINTIEFGQLYSLFSSLQV